MTNPAYEGYLETLAALVDADREQQAELAQARTDLRDASEDRARVLRQTETLQAVVREQLAHAGLPDLNAAPRPAARDGRSPSSALDVASRLAAQLSAQVGALLTGRAEARAQAEREVAERARRAARRRLWALVAAVVVIVVGAVLAFGLAGI